MNWYISTIVPAPHGWLQNGSADPGDEFYYTASLGEVYPGEYSLAQSMPFSSSGWVLHFYPGDTYIAGFATPTAAFSAYADLVCDTPEDRNPDGTLAHSECACPTEGN